MEEKNQTKNRRIVVAGIIIIILFSIAFTEKKILNDTFYSLKIGEYISQNGVFNLKNDVYSWHENIPYTYPHWLYDLIMFNIFKIGGWNGIYISTIVFTIFLGITCYMLVYKKSKKTVLSIVLTCLCIFLLNGFLSARAQTVTISLFLLILLLIEKLIETNKWRYGIILVILSTLIVNLHSAVWLFSMALYLPYIVEGVLYILLKNKKTVFNEICIEEVKLKKILTIFAINLLAGLINPVNCFNGYTYLIKTLKGPTLQLIIEHMPPERKAIIFHYAITLIPLLIICMISNIKIRLNELILYFVGLVLSIGSRRQFSINTIFTISLYANVLSTFSDQYLLKISKKIYKLLNRVYSPFVIVIFSTLIIYKVYEPKLTENYYTETDYPIEATEWMKNNLDINNIRLYNNYNIGSYLLFNDIKPFFDSRADLYTKEFNKKEDIFSDGVDMENGNCAEELIDKYNLTHIIIDARYGLYEFMHGDSEHYKLLYPTKDDKVECSYYKVYEIVKNN